MSRHPLAADPAALGAAQRDELPQKDELCGPFWGLIALRIAGVRADPAGVALDQDAVAQAAGSRLSPPPRTSLPPGESGRDDHRPGLAIDPEDPGTSAAGLASAITALSGGRLAVVAVTGAWERAALETLLDGLADELRPVAVIANLDTQGLWPVKTTADTLTDYLDTGRHEGLSSDWAVGHFVALTAIEHGAHGVLVDVADSYPTRGHDGVHRQPVERIAAALAGLDRVRGLLVVVDGDPAPTARLVTSTGLKVRLWDAVSRPRR